ncbi:hypothetical protein [Streptomyces qinzhouensis]|uniref:Uncharacterized protein n=1 Tax=Streptomyces qinzhouensis TaxID=2599401 RepID=A0A5B8JPN3_9ACTN|nr:hypothetical protein [Streptomyces qinzhouensis]QDY79820.1 hypothetical protein FQU76_28470 [Streptomyces qinzhouensis]
MRDSIARALAWVLCLCFPARGRHRAPDRPTPVIICAPRTPIPLHVLARTVPTREPFRIPPYMAEWSARQQREEERRRERRTALALADIGIDYPYTADHVHQVMTGVAA